mmetsp:Transcript_98132/g.300055  ORF Transcript_98132/g.300055 Transcript_98132/m.300055 type:complete len:291 (+) Transcript_98132:812-1684(+)
MVQRVVDLRHAGHALGMRQLLAQHVADLRGDHELLASHLARLDKPFDHLTDDLLGNAIRVVRCQVHKVTPDLDGQLEGGLVLLAVLQAVAAEADRGDAQARGAELRPGVGMPEFCGEDPLRALGRGAVAIGRGVLGRDEDEIGDVVVVVRVAARHLQRQAIRAIVRHDAAHVALLQYARLRSPEHDLVPRLRPPVPVQEGRRACGRCRLLRLAAGILAALEAPVVEALGRGRDGLVGPRRGPPGPALREVLRHVALGPVQGVAPAVRRQVDVGATFAQQADNAEPPVVRG